MSWFKDFWYDLDQGDLSGLQLVFFWLVVAPIAVAGAGLMAWVLAQVIFWVIESVFWVIESVVSLF